MSKSASDSNNAEILKLFPLWRHEGLAPLTTIIGYTTLLLDNPAENLTEKQKQFITIIRDTAMKASGAWHSPGDYITLSFENTDWEWMPVQLSEVCDMILSNSFKRINKLNIHVDVSAELPLVRADRGWLSIAITNLLEPSGGYLYNTEFRSSISAQEQDDKHILVKIRTGLQVSMDENYNSIESISMPGSYLSVASIILDKHESRLEFTRLRNDHNEFTSQGTEFAFVLSAWQ